MPAVLLLRPKRRAISTVKGRWSGFFLLHYRLLKYIEATATALFADWHGA